MRRFDYLDLAKGLGIIMVVWGHIMLVGMSHKLIYAFHMPLFFFISGLLFNKDQFDSLGAFFMHRAKRLLIPYFLYSVSTWGIWALFRYLRHDSVDSYIMPLIQTFIAQGSGAFMVHNSALWFVPCLFAVEILYYIFSRLNEWLTLTLCFTTAGIGALLVILYGDNYLFLLPWNLDAAFFALPFYGMANAIIRFFPHEKIMSAVTNHKQVFSIAIVILFSLMTILSMKYGECSMGSSSYGCPLSVYYVRAFSGCIGLVLLSALICSIVNKKSSLYDYIKWCGKNSFDIMCLHIPIKGVVVISLTKVLKLSFDIQENLLYSSLAFVITIAIMTPIIKSIHKYIKNEHCNI